MARELSAQDHRALAEFRYQIRRLIHFSESAARAARLNSQQHPLLLVLKGLPKGVEPNIGEIAERLYVRVLREITAQGEAVLQELSLTHRAQLDSVGAELIRSLKKLQKQGSGSHGKSRSNKKALKRSR